MKYIYFFTLLVIFITGGICSAQMNVADSGAVEDFTSASTNQPGKEFPKVNSEGRVRARISAPEAK